MDNNYILLYHLKMTTELTVNINQETARVIRWGELECHRSPETIIRMGVTVLQLMDNADEIYLLDKDGAKERIHSISPEAPSAIYDI
jgi:hypothetical protein